MTEREPDISDDPRQKDSQGHPADQGGEDTENTSAPDQDAGQDESPSGATGNPGAAGG